MAVESLQACTDDPLAEALLVHALRMLAQWLPQLHTAPDHAEPRADVIVSAEAAHVLRGK
jgi:alcohol dehydrogenase class IV